MTFSNTFDRYSPRRFVQTMLTRVGRRLSPRHVQFLNAFINYLETGRWTRSHGFANFPRYRSRRELHTAVAQKIANERVLYLEFGVYQGASLRLWCDLLKNPASSLRGFDSFEGLPENWDAMRAAGTFSLDGNLPKFNDARVVLHQGWFQDTLPSVALPECERLVIHLDADLYSSTELVLRVLRERIVPGTILIFDEFCDRFHELKAFDEYIQATGQKFSLLGATSNLEQVAFERLS
jgi:hypothetical protein